MFCQLKIMHTEQDTGYLLPNVEIKDNVLIVVENFLDEPVKNYMRIYLNIWKITTGLDYYTTGCLLDYHYFKEHFKLTSR